MNIILADKIVLKPNRDAGSLRMLNILNIIKDLGHNLNYLTDNDFCSDVLKKDLENKDIKIVIGSWEEYFRKEKKINDIIIVSRRIAYESILKLIPKKSKIIFDTVDLNYLRLERESKILKDNNLYKYSKIAKELEFKIMHNTNCTWVVSDKEKEFLYNECPKVKTYVIPTIQDCSKIFSACKDERCNLIFIAGFNHSPNVDAMKYFINEILPIIVLKMPNIQLDIIGEDLPISIKLANNVKYHGPVDDVTSLFRKSRVSIAPLRYGAGVKGKINTSMAHGVPVVATSVAAEGMNIIDNHTALIADSSIEFANAIFRLYESDDLWVKISENGFENLKKYFSIEVVKLKIKKSFDDLMA